MSAPVRIQRKRVTGWKAPPNTLCVTRPSHWGNPFVVGAPSGYGFKDDGDPKPLIESLTLEQCIELFDRLTLGVLSPEMHPTGHAWVARLKRRFGNQHPSEIIRSQLRGKNLACYCAPDCACHADILLTVANEV